MENPYEQLDISCRFGVTSLHKFCDFGVTNYAASNERNDRQQHLAGGPQLLPLLRSLHVPLSQCGSSTRHLQGRKQRQGGSVEAAEDGFDILADALNAPQTEQLHFC